MFGSFRDVGAPFIPRLKDGGFLAPFRNPQPLTHPVQPGTRVLYVGADAPAGGVGATVDGYSAAPGQPYRYHIVVDGEADGRQVDQSEIASAQ